MCYWIHTMCKIVQSNTHNFIIEGIFKATYFGSIEPSSSPFKEQIQTSLVWICSLKRSDNGCIQPKHVALNIPSIIKLGVSDWTILYIVCHHLEHLVDLMDNMQSVQALPWTVNRPFLDHNGSWNLILLTVITVRCLQSFLVTRSLLFENQPRELLNRQGLFRKINAFATFNLQYTLCFGLGIIRVLRNKYESAGKSLW